MYDAYKLQYNGMTLTYPGWGGFVGYENTAVPFQRYEYTIFGSNITPGVSAGNVSMPFSAFDTVGIRTLWHGQEWQSAYGNGMFIWYDKSKFSANTGVVNVPIMFSDSMYYYVFQTKLDYNNSNLSFSTENNQNTMYAGMTTTTGTTAKWTQSKNNSRHVVIGQIIGVKYQ